jgi:hypothetical protein
VARIRLLYYRKSSGPRIGIMLFRHGLGVWMEMHCLVVLGSRHDWLAARGIWWYLPWLVW